MSRIIDPWKGLSEEDYAYLRARGAAGEAEIHYYETHVKPRLDAGDAAPEEEEFEDVDSLSDEQKAEQLKKAEAWIAGATVPQLREQAEEMELDTGGNKDVLQKRLVEAVRERYAPAQ